MTNINLEHPEYAARKYMWRKYRDLYVGGEQLKGNATDYLARRQKEPLDVYGERLGRVFYENYVGSIIDWYAATLFRREPQLMVEGTSTASRKFFSDFAENCDMKGSALSDFFRSRLIDTLVAGRSYILVDFPMAPMHPGSRAEEDALGLSRAYLVEFSAESLINWSFDAQGNYEWVMLRSTYLRRQDADEDTVGRETVWRYYDRESFRMWKSTSDLSLGGSAADREPVLIAEGRHALAGQRRVPLFELKVSEGLWSTLR